MDTLTSWRLINQRICLNCLRALQPQSQSQAGQIRRLGNIARPGDQATPISGYYAELSITPTTDKQSIPKKQIPSTPSSSSQSAEEARQEVRARAKIVFGSRLAGPIARQAERERQSTNIAGVLVPPRPTEPDNCCMSGCVNCVWDVYREDLEEWAAKASDARLRLAAQGKQGGLDEQRLRKFSTPSTSGKGLPAGAASMDDDGGGSETNWDLGTEKSGAELFADIPVGIREFMRTEKMLKERHLRDGTKG